MSEKMTTQVEPLNSNSSLKEKKESNPWEYVPKSSFPQRLAKVKKGNSTSEIVEIRKQVYDKILLLDAIKKVPSYTKFLIILCAKKRSSYVQKKAFLVENISSMLQHKIPPKLKDLGSLTISCNIGNHIIDHALLELGANVNLLSYRVFVKLELGELHLTLVVLQLVDRFMKIPCGI